MRMARSLFPRHWHIRRAKDQSLPNRCFSTSFRRASASTPPPPPPSQTDRIQRIIRRTPKFLQPLISALHNAPLTHVSAFLILHELTAVIPILGLTGAFHYFQWLPPYFAEGKWVAAGVEKFGNYFRRKGWIDSWEKRNATELAESGEVRKVEEHKKGKGLVSRWWSRGETGTRLVVEVATAYAVVKLLLPLRLIISVWGTPWFARWTLVPVNNMVKSWFKGRPKGIGTEGTTAAVKAGGTNGGKVVK